MDIVEELKKRITPSTVIPKPNAKADFIVKGWGKRRGEEALIYWIPNHSNPSKPYEKGITVSESRQAYNHIRSGNDFTREWFNEQMAACTKEGGCNFTTIGGLFEVLGIVRYSGKGVHKAR
jgi:hypothetical protein